jgi:hypothetical protein
MMSFTNLASEAACGQVPVPGDNPQTLRPGNIPGVVFCLDDSTGVSGRRWPRTNGSVSVLLLRLAGKRSVISWRVPTHATALSTYRADSGMACG